MRRLNMYLKPGMIAFLVACNCAGKDHQDTGKEVEEVTTPVDTSVSVEDTSVSEPVDSGNNTAEAQDTSVDTGAQQ